MSHFVIVIGGLTALQNLFHLAHVNQIKTTFSQPESEEVLNEYYGIIVIQTEPRLSPLKHVLRF